jgi:hypothetical protein
LFFKAKAEIVYVTAACIKMPKLHGYVLTLRFFYRCPEHSSYLADAGFLCDKTAVLDVSIKERIYAVILRII